MLLRTGERVSGLFNFEGTTQYGLKPIKYGGVAQLGEHLPCKQGVRSSILLISTKLFYHRTLTTA